MINSLLSKYLKKKIQNGIPRDAENQKMLNQLNLENCKLLKTKFTIHTINICIN